MRHTQRGVATLLFIAFIAVALTATTVAVFKDTGAAQKLQYAGHTATQAEMSAWAGVTLLSEAVKQLPVNADLTEGGEVQFAGVSDISARYIGTNDDGLHIFEVTGSSAGARSVLRVALRPPSSPGGGGGESDSPPAGSIFHGPTTVQGSVNYTGAEPRVLHVLDGSLTLSGSVSGLQQVCATGDVTVSSAIHVGEVCANGNVTFHGGATVDRVKAIGDVSLAGGGTSAIGEIHSNGNVTLSGGSASAGRVLASGDVAVSGGNARATEISAEGDINWTSSTTAATLAANGTVNYRPSGTNVATDIAALGNVMLTSARNVRTQGATTLVGYWGQGISGRVDGQGLLGGTGSWGASGGAVVNAGTVGAIVSPYPSTVRVTVTPGYTVAINAVLVPEIAEFTHQRRTVDAYALQSEANLIVTGVDARGNPRVKVAKVHGVTDGEYYIANNPGISQNYLCKNVSGANCVDPLIKICQGYSNSNKCFSYNNGTWTIQGKTMLPWVLWFHGNLTVSNGVWVNTFLASGDITTSGSLKIYAPNYPPATYTCGGQADGAHSLQAWSSHGLAVGAYATQLCASATEHAAATIGNIALLAGGLQEGRFVGGNVSLGSSNEIYGAVLAGQYLNTGGSTVLAGSIYAAAQGGSTALTANRHGGSTTIRLEGGSSAYDPDIPGCITNCGGGGSRPERNVIWVAPA